jgi:hypothetical protein
VNASRFVSAVLLVALGCALETAHAQSIGVERTPGQAAPTTPVVSVDVGDEKAILKRWGVRIESLRLTASGYMLDFRYHVVDARKAKPLFVRKTKPVLKDEETGAVMMVPTPPKTGALRSSNDPKAGRTYFMFFANPGRLLAEGRKVTVTIGEFSVSGIPVASEGDRGLAASDRSPATGRR